jgi:hypothetical protein
MAEAPTPHVTASTSRAIAELAKRGFQVAENRRRVLELLVGGRRRIRLAEDLVAELLSRDDGGTLYVCGTVSNRMLRSTAQPVAVS